MRPSTLRLFALASLAATFTLALAGEARADPPVAFADDCQGDEVDPFLCKTAGIQFEKVDAAPFEFAFDSGWIPQGSDLQVHFWGGLHANTRLALAGSLVTDWPASWEDGHALRLTAPGDVDGGSLSFHYGLDVGAEAKIQISVFGQTYTWQGDVPYVPQIDFQVQGESIFDAWGMEPVSLTSSTEPVTLISVSVGDLVGSSIPGIDGGLKLDVAVDLTATWQCTGLRISDAATGLPVVGGAIVEEDGETFHSFLGGPFVELDVYPEGFVDYEATIHLIPTFFVELLGFDWDIPVVDFPISFPVTETEWTFDPVRVHVPLPDLREPPDVIDFGAVLVGEGNQEEIDLSNLGEAELRVTAVSALPEVFQVIDAGGVFVETGELDGFRLRFAPDEPGPFESTVDLVTNDPDLPIKTVTVRGFGVGDVGSLDPLGGSGGPGIAQGGSCGCRVVDPGDDTAGWVAALALAGALGARRRKRA